MLMARFTFAKTWYLVGMVFLKQCSLLDFLHNGEGREFGEEPSQRSENVHVNVRGEDTNEVF